MHVRECIPPLRVGTIKSLRINSESNSSSHLKVTKHGWYVVKGTIKNLSERRVRPTHIFPLVPTRQRGNAVATRQRRVAVTLARRESIPTLARGNEKKRCLGY
jgi:hypothetical protein